MAHLNSSKAARTSFSSFFRNTILHNGQTKWESELAGVKRLMDIVIMPTDKELSDRVRAVAPSHDEWMQFEAVYSSAVSNTSELSVIQRLVQLRKVQLLVLHHMHCPSPFGTDRRAREAAVICLCLG